MRGYVQFNEYTYIHTYIHTYIPVHTYIHTHRGTRTRIGSGRAEERRKIERNRKIVVDAVRETGDTRVEREKNVEKKGFVQ